jgi:hypothetical protein
MLGKVTELNVVNYVAAIAEVYPKINAQLLIELAFDMRTRVTPILAVGQLLQADEPSHVYSDDMKSMLQIITKSAEDLMVIITAFAQFASEQYSGTESAE